jgi:hypothetical protein
MVKTTPMENKDEKKYPQYIAGVNCYNGIRKKVYISF